MWTWWLLYYWQNILWFSILMQTLQRNAHPRDELKIHCCPDFWEYIGSCLSSVWRQKGLTGYCFKYTDKTLLPPNQRYIKLKVWVSFKHLHIHVPEYQSSLQKIALYMNGFGPIINSQSASRDNWCAGTLLNRIITAQWEGMGDVGSVRYEPALRPPCQTIRVLNYSNRQRSTHFISKWIFRNLTL